MLFKYAMWLMLIEDQYCSEVDNSDIIAFVYIVMGLMYYV